MVQVPVEDSAATAAAVFLGGSVLVPIAEVGSLAAVYCLECRGPQSHAYTRREFVTRFRKHFEDQGRLDALLKEEREKEHS